MPAIRLLSRLLAGVVLTCPASLGNFNSITDAYFQRSERLFLQPLPRMFCMTYTLMQVIPRYLVPERRSVCAAAGSVMAIVTKALSLQ